MDDMDKFDVIEAEEENDDNDNNEKPHYEISKKKLVNEIFDWIEIVVFAFCFVAICFTILFKVVTVTGPSMEKTLIEGQRLVISNAFYAPERGDIVVIDCTSRGLTSEPIIKRVIALGGDTVDIDFDNWITTVTTKDGEQIVYENEEYVNYLGGDMHSADGHFAYPYTVPEGEIFVMGDNRLHSSDSRLWGSFPEEEIVGRAILRLTPLDKIGLLK